MLKINFSSALGSFYTLELKLTLFNMGFIVAAHGSEVGGKKSPLPKICHTYPTTMEFVIVILCLKKIQKIFESHGTSLEFY